MKKIFYLILLILLISCKPAHWTSIGNGENMKYKIDNTYTSSQFDSICKENNINPDLNRWIMLPLRDDETMNIQGKYLMIQKMDSVEVIYTVLKTNGKYKVNKRITY